jgi:hypothetical protein
MNGVDEVHICEYDEGEKGKERWALLHGLCSSKMGERREKLFPGSVDYYL